MKNNFRKSISFPSFKQQKVEKQFFEYSFLGSNSGNSFPISSLADSPPSSAETSLDSRKWWMSQTRSQRVGYRHGMHHDTGDLSWQLDDSSSIVTSHAFFLHIRNAHFTNSCAHFLEHNCSLGKFEGIVSPHLIPSQEIRHQCVWCHDGRCRHHRRPLWISCRNGEQV